jgi:hypothetical protein
MSFQHGDEFNHTIYLPALPAKSPRPNQPIRPAPSPSGIAGPLANQAIGVRYSQAIVYEARTPQYVPWQVRRPREIDLYEAVELVKSTWGRRVIPPRLSTDNMVALAWYGFCLAQVVATIILTLKEFL